MATLYVVATPIGNLEDISLRAIRILGEVDAVLCEDTRVTKKLLSHYGIENTTISYHEHSSTKKIDGIAHLLLDGKNLALVSDAGTPGISDPGTFLIDSIRKSVEGVSVVAVPGPSALVSALSIAGIPIAHFVFLGFLPHKKGRETLFKEMALSERASVFYESPHRIMKTLESLCEHMPKKQVFIGRELTKMYEEGVRGTAVELKEYFEKNPDKVRGEFVVVVSPE